MGTLLDQARLDIKNIISSGGFEIEIVLSTPDEMVSISITGLASKHHESFDPETGNVVNSPNVHVTVHETDLIENTYPYKNGVGEIDLEGHLVSASFFGENPGSYKVDQFIPSNTVGAINLILVKNG